MNYTVKKTISILLTLILLLNMAPVSAQSDGTIPSSSPVKVGAPPATRGTSFAITVAGDGVDLGSQLADGAKKYYVIYSPKNDGKPIAHRAIQDESGFEFFTDYVGTQPAPTSEMFFYIVEDENINNIEGKPFSTYTDTQKLELSKNAGNNSGTLGAYHFQWTYSDTGYNISVTNELYTATVEFHEMDGSIDTGATIPTNTKYYAVFSVNNSAYCIKEYSAPQNGKMTISLTNGDKFKSSKEAEGVALSTDQLPKVDVYEYTGSNDFETKFFDNKHWIDDGKGTIIFRFDDRNL